MSKSSVILRYHHFVNFCSYSRPIKKRNYRLAIYNLGARRHRCRLRRGQGVWASFSTASADCRVRAVASHEGPPTDWLDVRRCAVNPSRRLPRPRTMRAPTQCMTTRPAIRYRRTHRCS